MPQKTIQIIGLNHIPEIKPGADLTNILIKGIEKQKLKIENNDIFVIAQKIVSKAEGQIINLNHIKPSTFATIFSLKSGKDARLIELILQQSKQIIRMDMDKGTLITETIHGLICANAGIDSSNVDGSEYVTLLPDNPDLSAKKLYYGISSFFPNLSIPVIISDTFGRPWRNGQNNVAIGIYGMDPIKDYRNTKDVFGNTLSNTMITIADEIAAAAELVMGKTNRIPIVLIKGINTSFSETTINTIFRNPSEDLFR